MITKNHRILFLYLIYPDHIQMLLPKQLEESVCDLSESSRGSTIANGSILTIWTRLRSIESRGFDAGLKPFLKLFRYTSTRTIPWDGYLIDSALPRDFPLKKQTQFIDTSAQEITSPLSALGKRPNVP